MHTTILTLHENQAPANVRQVLYTSDTTAAGRHPESYWMDYEVYDDLGQPAAIEVKVEVYELPPPPEDQLPLPSEIDTPVAPD